MSMGKFSIVVLFTLGVNVLADERIELDTTTIKGNTELPKYLYVVPWQDRTEHRKVEQKLVLHNLYSDLFDPLMPQYIEVEELTRASPGSE